MMAAALAVIALSSCSRVSTGGSSSGGGAVPGVVRIVGIESMDNLVPELSATSAAVDVGMFWGGWFFLVNDKGELEPDLATEVPTLENGGISKDGLTIRYRLRRGVRWQDGAPFTAADAIFTWRQIMNPQNNVLTRSGYDQIGSMNAPDPYTLLVHLKHPYSPAVASFFGPSLAPMCVLPEHLLKGLPNINHAAYTRKPVGTGPFIVASYEPGLSIVLRANPDYWRGKPKLREVRFLFVADSNTKAVMMRTGEADLNYDPANQIVPELASIPDTHVLHVPFNEFWYLGFNLTHPPLDDIRVRRAIAMGVDKQYVIRTILHGLATPAQSDQPAYSWAYDATVRAASYDPTGAARLLDSAGWKMGPDGIRHKDGKALELTYAYSINAPDTQRLSPIFQGEMKQIGISIRVKGYSNGLYYAAKPSGGIVQSGNFDIAAQGWLGGVDPDDKTLWTCDERPPNGFNAQLLCDSRIDAQERIALTSYDRNIRKTAYQRIQRLLNEDIPVVFLYWTMRNDSVRNSLRGYRPAPTVTEFWNSWAWE